MALRRNAFASDLRARLAKPKPIGFYLFLLIAVTIVPAMAVSWVLLQRNDEVQREVVTTLAEATANSITEAVDRELSGMVTTLRVLSTTPTLAEGDLSDFYARAQSALRGTGAYLVLLDDNLMQLFNTRRPFGETLAMTSDPESAQRAIEDRSAVISDLFFGNTSQEWVFTALLPFFPEEGPPSVLVMVRNAEDLADSLSQHMLRGGWNASLVDRDGVVLASSFMSSEVGEPFFLDIGDTSTGRITAESDSQSYDAIVSQSEYSGWKAVVWAPTATVEAPMRRSLRLLLIGGLVVIAIGAAGAWLLGRQIAKPVRRLARDARRLGAGEPVRATLDDPIAEVATVSAALAQAAEDRRKAESDIRLLMREVAHRAKNQLTVVASIAKQSARSARSFAGFQDAFQKRLYGLARSTDLLVAGGAEGVELRELLLVQIEPFGPDDIERLKLDGPAFRLASQPAQTIGMAVHELATNASKYGAFAHKEGRLVVSWKVRKDKLRIVWREYLPRLRRRASKRGFGTEVLERVLGGTLHAEITRTFHRDGLECVFTIPVENLVPDSDAN